MNGDQHIVFPNGWCMHYKDNKHSYQTCSGDPEHLAAGPLYTGCSTASKVFDFEHDVLMNWAVRLSLEGVALLAAETDSDRSWLKSQEDIQQALKEHRLTFRQLRQSRAESGTTVHDLIETIALGGLQAFDKIPMNELTVREQLHVRSLRHWWETTNPHVLNAEQFVLSKKYHLAGRFDLRYRGENGIISLADFKTGWVGPGAHCQLRLYDVAARECGIGASDVLMAVQLDENGEPPVEHLCGVSNEEAVAALPCYRANKRIEQQYKDGKIG